MTSTTMTKFKVIENYHRSFMSELMEAMQKIPIWELVFAIVQPEQLMQHKVFVWLLFHTQMDTAFLKLPAIMQCPRERTTGSIQFSIIGCYF